MDPPQRPFYHGDIAFGSVEAVLGGHHFVPFCLKSANYLIKARAVGPYPVAKHDTLFYFWHICFLCFLIRFVLFADSVRRLWLHPPALLQVSPLSKAKFGNQKANRS